MTISCFRPPITACPMTAQAAPKRDESVLLTFSTKPPPIWRAGAVSLDRSSLTSPVLKFSIEHALCTQAYYMPYQLQKLTSHSSFEEQSLVQFHLLIHNCKRREQRDLFSLLLSGFSTHLVNLLIALSCPCAGESSHLRKSFITREPGH